MNTSFQVLVVDDDEVTRNLLKEVLTAQGFSTECSASAEDALERVASEKFSIILTDLKMIKLDGIDLLRILKKKTPKTIVILMTGFGSMEGAIQAIQEGAFDYISKPFGLEAIKAVMERASRHWKSLSESKNTQVFWTGNSKTLVGKSSKIVEVYKLLARAALSTSTVLITGESGTGKELVARAIHENSARKSKKFIAINCGALSENLLESELFGHLKGAFTGAIADKKGLFEEANDGTLFLDEIGDISSALQIRLLRALQENEIRPVGSSDQKKINVRVIVATHRNLGEMVMKEKFREDLYYRLKVILIQLPPLKDRMEDLPDLAEHFLKKASEKNRKVVSRISEAALKLLLGYHWPGNIRELENSIERAVALTNSTVLFPEDFSQELFVNAPFKEKVEEAEKLGSLFELEQAHILQVLSTVGYNKTKAAEILGIDRATLYRKAQKYKINLNSRWPQQMMDDLGKKSDETSF